MSVYSNIIIGIGIIYFFVTHTFNFKIILKFHVEYYNVVWGLSMKKDRPLPVHISMSILSGVISNCKRDCIAAELGHFAALLFYIFDFEEENGSVVLTPSISTLNLGPRQEMGD